MIIPMELRHLRYFVAVAEEENVTRAAERLHVSQPPLSRQIRDLEEELGVELFERTARSVRLTGAGKVFLGEARAVLQRADEARAKVRDAGHLPEGPLSVRFAPSLTVDLLPEALLRFQKSHPSVRVSLHDLSSEGMIGGLRRGDLQLALMAHPGRSLPKGFAAQPIRDLDYRIAIAKDHPLAKRRSLRIADLRNIPLLGYSRADYPEYFRDVLTLLGGKAAGKKQPSPFAEEYESGSALIAAVQSGQGAALVVEGIGQLAGSGIVLLPLVPRKTALTLVAAWRGKKVPAAALPFLEALRTPA